MKKKRILITGGTGFIGYYLAKKCLSKKWSVVSFSKNIPKKVRYLKNVQYFKGDLSIREGNVKVGLTFAKRPSFFLIFNNPCSGLTNA